MNDGIVGPVVGIDAVFIPVAEIRGIGGIDVVIRFVTGDDGTNGTRGGLPDSPLDGVVDCWCGTTVSRKGVGVLTLLVGAVKPPRMTPPGVPLETTPDRTDDDAGTASGVDFDDDDNSTSFVTGRLVAGGNLNRVPDRAPPADGVAMSLKGRTKVKDKRFQQ